MGQARPQRGQRRKAPSTPEGRVFSGLIALNELRRHNPAFSPSADVWTLDTGDDGVLSIGRYARGQKIMVFLSLLSGTNVLHSLMTGVCSPKCLPGRPRPCRH